MTTPIRFAIPVGSAGPLAADTTPPHPTGSVLDWPGNLGQWVTDLPHHLAALGPVVAGLWWPWVPVLVSAVLVGTIAVRLLVAWRWRRVADRGYWVAITPPRQVDAARWALVWRRLEGLARRARGGRWRLVRPPLAFEVYADTGRVRAGLWLPGWLPLSVVAGEVARAWPGATVHGVDPLPLGMHRDRVAGVQLAADLGHPETGWLVDDPHPRTGARRGSGADPDLGMVFSALADPGAEGARRLLLQVLVRPAPSGRVARLAAAARHPASQRAGGVRAGADGLVWLLQTGVRALLSVVELFVSSGGGGGSSGARTAKYTPDAFEREAMADARAKRNDRPHVLVSIRVGAASDRRGQARQAARSVADGYAEASRWLVPVRLRRAAVALGLRRARRGDWLLVSASELGVLAHLPPDPALYRLDTAALHRAAPVGAWQAAPEPGWTRYGWTDSGHDTEGDPDAEDAEDFGDAP